MALYDLKTADESMVVLEHVSRVSYSKRHCHYFWGGKHPLKLRLWKKWYAKQPFYVRWFAKQPNTDRFLYHPTLTIYLTCGEKVEIECRSTNEARKEYQRIIEALKGIENGDSGRTTGE